MRVFSCDLRSILFTFFAILCISCSVQDMEELSKKEDPSGSAHLSSEDILRIDGVFQLALTLEEAKNRGISEDEFVRVEKDIRAFNAYNERFRRSAPTRTEGFTVIYELVDDGTIIYKDARSYPLSVELDYLSAGDYYLLYAFSSESIGFHSLSTSWYPSCDSHLINDLTDYSEGESHEGYQSGSLELLYRCAIADQGMCYWELYRKIVLPLDDQQIPLDNE